MYLLWRRNRFSQRNGVDQADRGVLLGARLLDEKSMTGAEPGGAALDIGTTSKIKATVRRKRNNRGRDRVIRRRIGYMIARLPGGRLP
jgi:hypothetical protein